MERTFKHKKTGEVAYYKDGVFKQGRFCVEIGVEPSSEFWEEVISKDYEILEVKGTYGAISSYIQELDADLKDKYIYKIKRLSDG
jgi:hypothetical protein